MIYKLKKDKNFVLSDLNLAGIYVTKRFSNFFITLTDSNHKVIVCKSAGSAGIKGNKKRKTTPQAIETIALSLNGYFKRYDIKKVNLFIKSRISQHMFALVQYLLFLNITIVNITTKYALPHSYNKKRSIRRK